MRPEVRRVSQARAGLGFELADLGHALAPFAVQPCSPRLATVGAAAAWRGDRRGLRARSSRAH